MSAGQSTTAPWGAASPFAGAGKIRALARDLDWTATQLGAPERWPQSLRTAVDLCLGSAFPAFVWWGPSLVQLYNESALAVVREKHPASFGVPAAQAWSDVWDSLGPLAERVLATGEAIRSEDLPTVPDRSSHPETSGFSFSYSAIRDETRSVAGLFIIATETTDLHQARGVRYEQAAIDRQHSALADGARATERAKASEALTAAIVQHLPGAAVFVVDEALRFVVAEGEAITAAGLTSADLVGRSVGEALGMRVEAEHAPFYRRALAGETFEREHENHGRIYLTRGAPLRNEQGQTYAALAISTDITERRRAKEAMYASEARYRSLFDSIDEGFCVVEMLFDGERPVDYRFLETNPAFVKQTGLADAVGRTMRELAPAHEAHWFETYGRVARTGEPTRFEARADALGRWYDVYAFRLGEPAARRVAILFNDVGTRKRFEAALTASEARYRALATASADVIYSMSPDWAEMRELDGRGFLFDTVEPTRAWLSRYIHPDDQMLVVAAIDEAVRTAGTFELEHRVVRADGTMGWTLSRAIPVVDVDHAVTGWIGAASDVTARREAEEALRASEERHAFLLALSDRLRPLKDAREIMTTAAEMLGRHLRVAIAQYLLVDRDGDGFRVVASYSDGRLPRAAATRGRISDHGPDWGPQIRTGKAIFSDDHEMRSPEDAAATRAFAVRSGSAVPLLRDGRLVAILSTGHVDVRHWTELEKALQLEIAERTWAAVERARAEAALRASEAKYRAIFDSIDEGFATLEVVYDADGQPVDLRYLETNRTFEQQSGLSGAEGRSASELLHILKPEWLERYARVALTGEPSRSEEHRSDTDRWFNLYLSRVGGEGSPVVAAVFADITERKRATSALASAAARDAFLVQLADALRPLADPVAIQAQAARLLGEYLATSHAHYGEVEGETVVIREGYGNGLPPMVGTFHHAREGWGARMLDSFRAGRTAVCSDVDTDPTITPAEAAVITGAGFRAYVAVPLFKEGRWVAVLGVTNIAPRVWRADEIALVEATAERTWAAVERARAEAALRQSDTRYRLIVEGASDYAIFTADRDGRITSWSPGAEAMFGWTFAEAVGQPFALIFVPEDRAAGQPERELAVAAERGVAPDVRWHQGKDGVRVFLDGSTRALHDERGQLSGFLKIGQDVTNRRAMDEALRASESRYRTLVENVRDYAIFLLGPDGIITEWTAGAERVMGYTSEEVICRHVSVFYTPDDVAAEEPARELAEAAATGRAEREGFRVCKGGERFWANEIATAVHDRDGRLVGFTKISRDLTEQRKVEAAAERVRTAAERDALRRRLATAEEDERRRLSRELHDEAGQHLTALALGLQGLSDVTPPGSEVDRRAADLRELADTLGRELHAVSVRLRPRALDDFGLEAALSAYAEDWARQSGIALDVHARMNLERLPEVVESALYRIVQEALTNVARHSGATRASVVLERRDGQVVTVVEDDGLGFESDEAVGPTEAGPGLGLLGMRERAALLGGSLDIESTPGGGGTTLFVRIPITHPDDPARSTSYLEPILD